MITMKRYLIILFLMMLIGTASAASTLYLMPLNASEPMPNVKQSADTIHRDVATSKATYLVPGVMSETVSAIMAIPTTAESTAAEAGAVHYTHYGTWISNPLATQWVNGTVTVNLSMRESSSSANVNPRLKIYKWYANDTKGAELRAIGNSATEVGTSYPATPVRYFNAVALTNTSFEDGDRIAVELESYDNNAVTTSWLHGIRYGSISGGNMSYVRFSQNLTYLPPKTIPVYTGQRPINTNLSSIGDSSAKSVAVADEMYKAMKKQTFPINYTDGTTAISIKRIDYDLSVAKWGVWIDATRDGQEVHTHSPVWIVNSPYEVVVSSSTDTIRNEEIVTLKESPLEAAQQVLSGYVSRQPLGIAEGDDVLLVYTSGNGDGDLIEYNKDLTWTNLIAATTADIAEPDGAQGSIWLRASHTTNQFKHLARVYMEFNSSALPDDCTINSAIVGTTGHISTVTTLGVPALSLVGFNPATNGTAVFADFNKFSNTRYATDISGGSWSTSGYNNFTLNAAGIGNISKTAYTNTGIILSWELDGFGGIWEDYQQILFYIQTQEHGTTGQPFIEITYTPAAGGSAPVSSFTTAKSLYRIPGTLQVNDTSTNTPTVWNWSWGDGTWTNGTTRNATHKYTTRGTKSVLLVSSNANGANTTPTASKVRIVGYENLW